MSKVQEILFSVGALAAVVSAIMTALGWRAQNVLARRARRADYLKDQIRNLYGPLAFLLEAGHRGLEDRSQLATEYQNFFKGGREMPADEMELVLRLIRIHDERLTEANTRLVTVAQAHWGWLDPDDADPVAKYVGDVQREAIEHGEGHVPATLFLERLMSGQHRDTVHDAALLQRIRLKLSSKQAELSGP